MPGPARPAEDVASSQRIAAACACRCPGLTVAGSAEPIRVNIDFETGVVDQIIERLTMVRALRPASIREMSCDAPSCPPAGLCMCH